MMCWETKQKLIFSSPEKSVELGEVERKEKSQVNILYPKMLPWWETELREIAGYLKGILLDWDKLTLNECLFFFFFLIIFLVVVIEQWENKQ